MGLVRPQVFVFLEYLGEKPQILKVGDYQCRHRDGEVVDVYLQRKRDGAAAKRVFKRLLRGHAHFDFSGLIASFLCTSNCHSARVQWSKGPSSRRFHRYVAYKYE